MANQGALGLRLRGRQGGWTGRAAAVAAALLLVFNASAYAQRGQARSATTVRPSIPEQAAPALHSWKSSEPVAEPAPDAPARDRALAKARILAELGRDGEAQKIFLRLARQYPKDQEIVADLAEFLIDRGDVATAMTWLEGIENPNPRILRLTAAAAVQGGNPGQGVGILHNLLQESPHDAGLLLDLAAAYAAAGDPALAAQTAKEAQALAPSDQNVQATGDDLRDGLRPYAQTFFQSSTYGGTSIVTAGAEATSPVVERVSLKARVEHIVATKHEGNPPVGIPFQALQPDGTTTPSAIIGYPTLSQTIESSHLTALWHGPHGLEIEAGGNVFQGNATVFGQNAAIRYSPWQATVISVEGARNEPWYDPPEAAVRQGTYEQVKVRFETVYRERTALSVEALATRYAIDNDQPYADRLAMIATVSRRILAFPELWLGYTFAPAALHYQKGPQIFFFDGVTPTPTRIISLNTTEAIHQVAADLILQPQPWLRLELNGGVGRDVYRPGPFAFVAPAMIVRLTKALEWESRAEYQSETSFVRDGEESFLLFSALRLQF